MIEKLETMMWEAAKNRDSKAFLTLVDENAVMICGGFRLSGREYAQIIKEFDCSSYEISDFETVSQSESSVTVHYVIKTKVSSKQNEDLAGKFHVTSTWEKKETGFKLVFNMDSKIAY